MAVSHNHALPAQGSQASRGAGGASQSQLADPGFRQALEQQISEAIQPVMDEFRQQMAEGRVQVPQAGEVSGDSGAGGAEAGHDGQRDGQRGRASPPSSGDQAEARAEVPVKNVAQSAQRAPTGPVGQALQGVEHLGGQWLQSVLVSGLGALLAESTHAAVRQRAEQGLHTLLQKLFDAVPSGMSNQTMRRKTEQTLQLILRDALDAVFAEPVRASVQQGGQQTIEKSLHGDVGGVLQKIQETLQVMVTALVDVLRRHQQTLLRLLLAFALLALQQSLVHSDSDHSDSDQAK